MRFSLDFRAHSETGPVRKNNQDSGFASPNALVVADGMGGAAAGDLASAVAISEIAKADQRLVGDETLTKLSGAVTKANDKIADLVAADHTLDGMGTTVCGAFFSGDEFGMLHIGDSRGYRLREGQFERLTHDHSWVQSLIDEGKLTEAEAAVHPHRSLVLKVLNGQPSHVPDTEMLEAREGDRILFCSDGLSGFTTDDVMAKAMALPNLDDVMATLVQAAYHGGGADNITIILAEVVPQSDELDAQPAQILGAAAEIEVPAVVAPAPVDLGDAGPDGDDGSRRVPRAPAPSAEDPEQSRYRPTLEHRGRWRAPALVLGILLVLGGAMYGGYAWSQTQYFVAEADGKVAIYRGVDVTLPVVPLKHVEESSQILVDGLPKFYRDQVRGAISAKNLDAARLTVQNLQNYEGACLPVDPEQTPTSSPTPTPTPTPTATPTPGGSGTPTATGSGTPATPTARPGSPTATGSATPSPSPPAASPTGGSQPNGGC